MPRPARLLVEGENSAGKESLWAFRTRYPCLQLVALLAGLWKTPVSNGGLVPRDTRTPRKDIAPLVLVQHMPEDWAVRYNARSYLFKEPILHRLHTDPQPFSRADAHKSCPISADRKLVGGEAAVFGLTGGFIVPVTILDQRVAAVSFGGDRPALAPESAAALGFAANFAVGQGLQLHASASATSATMKRRERECLLWSSDGKTESVIAEILRISTSTVSNHIASAPDKLDAMNKTHAVAITLRRKMLV